jgi:hypothetical protein
MTLDDHIETFIYTNKYALLNQIEARKKAFKCELFYTGQYKLLYL